MDLAAIVTVAVVAAALLGVWLLPLRRRWNDDGSDDEARQRDEAHPTAGVRAGRVAAEGVAAEGVPAEGVRAESVPAAAGAGPAGARSP